jgi:nucleotide-binding universal stress UspA family protein
MSILAVVVREDAAYEAVLRAAAELAGGESFEVLSLYPLPPSGYEDVPFRAHVRKTATAREAERRLIEADLTARTPNATVSVPVARLANVGDDIVQRAREAGASVIVIGTHGRTGLSRLFVGSVAERVVRHAHCDVHVARPRQSG